MENVKEYIESGILELYVLGEISQDEKIEVEEMIKNHPAIRAELDEIEKAMEDYAFEHKVEPSADLRNRVLNSLLTNFGDDRTFPQKTAPAPAIAKIVAMPVKQTNNFYKYAFAACLALLLVSVAALVTVYNQLQVSNTQLVAANTQKQQFTRTVSMQDHQLTIFRDTAYRLIKLQGTPKAPAGSQINIAWSPNKKKVIIDMAGLKMPVNDKDHQYQLWAIVAGKPVDLGVFDAKGDGSVDMKVMKSVGEPQVFAVTLEPRGGSVNPTMDQMMVVAKI